MSVIDVSLLYLIIGLWGRGAARMILSYNNPMTDHDSENMTETLPTTERPCARIFMKVFSKKSDEGHR